MSSATTTRLTGLRREELRRAAYEMAGEHGFQALTIEKIARHAGISKGIIHHYFKSKDELVEHTVRYAHSVFRQLVRDRLKLAKSPSGRLWSVIDAYFAPEIFRYRRLWLSLFQESRINPRLGKLYEIHDRRLDMHIFMPLRHLVPASEVTTIATSILNLLDGLWFIAASDPRLTPELALSNIAEYLRTHVPGFDLLSAVHTKLAHSTRPIRPVRIHDVRRQELLAAAFAVLKRDGLPATTIDKIAEKAGCSRGVIHHYFHDKEALIFAALRHTCELHRKKIVERLHTAKTPSERIWAVLSANLEPGHLNHDNCNIWISIFSEAFTNSNLSRLQRVVRRREHSNLLHALRQISVEADARNSATQLLALMQASTLWTGYIPSYGASQARDMILSFLRTNVPGFDPAAVLIKAK